MTTVAQLIEILEKLPQELPVRVATYEENFDDIEVSLMEADNILDYPPHVRVEGR
jgi:hypothetical protein